MYIYQFQCDQDMYIWVNAEAKKKRWPRSTVVVVAVEKYLASITYQEVILERQRNITYKLTNAEITDAMGSALRKAQDKFGTSQAPIVRACIKKCMKEEGNEE